MSRCVATKLWYLTSGSACVISSITRPLAPRSSMALRVCGVGGEVDCAKAKVGRR